MKNTVIQGDCLEVMKGIPDNSIDLIVTDPPYNMNYSGRGKINKFNPFDNDNLSPEAHSKWFEDCLIQFNRILKDNKSIYIYIDFRNYARIFNIVKKYFDIKNCIVWDKKSIGMGQSYRFQHEFIIYAVNGKPKLNFSKKNVPDIFSVSRERSLYKHPTQKPLGIVEPFILYSSDANDVVLDAFAGSGTTGVACINTNRNYILIEKEQEYIDVINKRLSETKNIPS